MIILLGSTASAATYWVSPTGNDSNPGLDSTSAWASIDRGDQLSVLVPGDTVLVLPGSYSPTGKYQLNIAGTAAAPIVYRAFDSGVVIDGQLSSDHIFETKGNHIRIDGFSIQYGNKIGIKIDGDSCGVSDCFVRDVQEIGIESIGLGTLIIRNIVARAGKAGIEVDGEFNLTYNNTVIDPQDQGIHYKAGVASGRIFNNIIVGASEGIRGKETLVAGYNDLWQNSQNFTNGVSDSAGGLLVDPQFANHAADDFSLYPSSLCRNAGTDVGLPFKESAPDMGALEYDSSGGDVYWVSPTGNDGNDGLDSTTAWASIDRGDQLGILLPGDTVNIMPGLYSISAPLTLTRSGSEGQPIVYRGYRDGVVIDGSGLNFPILEQDGNYCEFANLRLQNTQDNGIDMGGAKNLIRHCVVAHVSKYGIYLTAGADSCRIYNNTFYDVGNIAVYMVSSVKTTRILNNIMVYGANGIWGPSETTAGHNNIWQYASPYAGTVSDSAGGISVNPQFADTATSDYRLQSGSECIDAGLDIGYSYEGAAPDMGAFEYNFDGNDPPYFTPVDSQSVGEGNHLVLSILAFDYDLTVPSLTAENAPLNSSFVDNGDGTGDFTFDPDFDQAGSYNVRFIASDGELADTLTVVILVSNFNRRPVLNPIGPLSVTEGDALSLVVSASDPDGTIPDLATRDLPLTCKFVDSGDGTGGLEYNPNYTAAGSYDVLFIATDGVLADSEVVVITVTPAPVFYIDVTPDTVTVEILSSVQFTATGYDAGSKFVADLTDSVVWTTSDPDGSTAIGGLYTAGGTLSPPEYHVTGVYDGSIADSSEVTVITSGITSYIRIEWADGTPVGDTTVSTDNDLIELFCRSYDAGGNPLGDVAVTWSVTGTDSICAVVPSYGTSTILNVERVGTGRIAALSAGSLVDTSGLFTTEPGEATSLAISPSSVRVDRGDTVNFSVDGFDADGNPTTVDAVAWSVYGRMGAIDSAGTFVATSAGWGRVVAASSAAVADTTDPIIVEAVEMAAIPLGTVFGRPGGSDIPVMALYLENFYNYSVPINSLGFRVIGRGPGSISQILGGIDSLGLYVDNDGDSILTAADSLIARFGVDSGYVDCATAGLEIPAEQATVLLLGLDLGLSARDGDSLDLYMLPGNDIVLPDSVVWVGADSLNSRGVAIVNGAVLAQYQAVPQGNSTIHAGDTIYSVATVDIPRNGYYSDTLVSFAFVNAGTAVTADFDSLLLYKDDGDGVWTVAADESYEGRLLFTGQRWELSGLECELISDVTRFYLAADVSDYPFSGVTIIPAIPQMGVGVSSGNDGPIDGDLVFGDTLTVQSNEVVRVTKRDGPALVRSPGEFSGGMFGLQFTNVYNTTVRIDSLHLDLNMNDPDGALQADLDSQIDSVVVWSDVDGTVSTFDGVGAIIGRGSVVGGVAHIAVGGIPISGQGGMKNIAVGVYLSSTLAKDGNTIAVSLGSTGVTFDSPYAVSGDFPLEQTSALTIELFESDAIILHPLAGKNISSDTINYAVLDFELPANGYAADSLRSLQLRNTGNYDDGSLNVSMHLHADLTSDGFTPDDPQVGKFAYDGASWRLENVSYPIAQPGTRFFAVVLISDFGIEGGSLQFELPVGGAVYASGADGPDDAAIVNPNAMLVLPTDRVTTIVVPEASTPAVPGSKRNRLLSFAFYNGYVNQIRTLSGMRLSSFSRSASSSAFADHEIGQLQLYYDVNRNRVFDDDSLMVTGALSGGVLDFNDLDFSLPPESLSYFFIVADFPLDLIDADSLAVGIAKHSDLTFNESVSLNGDVPLKSGGYHIVNGSIAQQYEIYEVGTSTLRPSDSNVLLFAFSPAINGDLADELQALTLSNQGTAGSSDIASMQLWWDLNDDGAWQSGDSLIGTFTPSGSNWLATGLAFPVSDPSPRLLVIADISASAADNATISLRLPVSGCRYASANDGPLNMALTSGEVLTISQSSLTVTTGALKPAYSVGQTIAVNVHVTNTFASAIDSVQVTSTPMIAPGILVLDSAQADAISLGVGQQATFRYFYSASMTGTVSWRVQAYSSVTGDSSAVVDMRTVTVQTPPSAINAQFIDAMPTAVTRGQANVYPLSLKIVHPDSTSSAADCRLDSLRLHITDGSGAPLLVGEVLDRVLLTSGQATLYSAQSLPSASSLLLDLLEPAIIRAGDNLLLSLLIDVDSTTTANSFALSFETAGDIVFVDDNNDATVPLGTSLQFPIQTSVCRIDDPSEQLMVSATPLVGSRVNYGQLDVELIRLDFRHPGLSTNSRVQLSQVDLSFLDSVQAKFAADRLFSSVWMTRNGFVVGSLSGFALDSTNLHLALFSPMTLNPGESASLTIRGSLLPNSSLDRFSLIVSDSSKFIVRDVSSGARIDVATDTTILATGSAFPIVTGVALLGSAAIPPEGCLVDLTQSTTLAGADAVPLVELQLAYPSTGDYAPACLRYIGIGLSDSLGAPLNTQNLFDRIGYQVDGGPIEYLPAITFDGGLTQFMFTDVGLLINPGESRQVRLVADIEADPGGITHFSVLVPGTASIQLEDAVDTSRLLQVVSAGGCASPWPFTSTVSRIISPAASPTFRPQSDEILIASRGQANIDLMLAELTYNVPTSRGNVVLTNLSGRLLRKGNPTTLGHDAQSVFTSVELVVNGQTIASQTDFTGDSIVLTPQGGMTIVAGDEFSISIRGSLTADAPIGNYLLAFEDSASIVLTDPGLSVGVSSVLEGVSYPFYSRELSVTEASLEHSYSNYPNPFRPGSDGFTTIAYSLAEDARVSIEIFTITGEPVRTVAQDAFRAAGAHQVDRWYGINDVNREAAPGTYYCLITATYTSGRSESFRRKVALLR